MNSLLKLRTTIDWEQIDIGILPAVEILRKNGIDTFESCEGGEGHSFPEPTVRFWGNEIDCIRAYDICQYYRLNVSCTRKVFEKEAIDPYRKGEYIDLYPNGFIWSKPFNEIVFCRNVRTGTIFLPD
jgi:hypothetical protein